MHHLVPDVRAVGGGRLVARDDEREARLRRPQLDERARLSLVAVEAGGAVGRAEHEREAVLVPRHPGALVRSRGLGDAVGRRARDEPGRGKLELARLAVRSDDDHDRARVAERADDEQVARPLDEPEHHVALRDQLLPGLAFAPPSRSGS